MKITKFTINQTLQVKQYHPLNLQVEFEVADDDDQERLQNTIGRAHKFVHNTLRADVYREMMQENMNDDDRRKCGEFIKKHTEMRYFNE